MSTAHVIQFLIQSAGLSLFAAVVASCPRRPERRASAALIGLLVCGLLPLLSSAPPVRETVTRHQVVRVEIPRMMETPVPVVSEAPVETTMPVTPQASAPVVREPIDFRWMIWLLPTGVLLGILKIARDVWITRRWSASLAAPDDTQWQRIESASPETMARSVFRVSNVGPGPCLIGFWKPRIVLPAWLLEPGKNHELEWAIRHECEHLRAHDSQWIVAVRLMTALHWWKPFTHLLAGNWDQSRERVCDLKAAGDGGGRPEYGHFILKLAAADQPRMAAAMASSGNAKRLRKRIDSLLGAKRGVSRIGTLWRVAMIGLMCGAGWVCSGFGFAQENSSVTGRGAGDDMGWLDPKPLNYVQASVLISPQVFASKGELLDEQELVQRLARLAGTKGFGKIDLNPDLMETGFPLSLQWAVTSDQERTDPPWDGHKTLDRFVGWVIHLRPLESDPNHDLRVQVAYAFPQGVHPAPGPYMKVNSIKDYDVAFTKDREAVGMPVGRKWNDVVTKTLDDHIRIEPGKIACVSIGEVEENVHATLLIGIKVLMPWENHGLGGGFAALSKESDRVEVRRVRLVDYYNADQKAEYERLQEMRKQLQHRLESFPANRALAAVKAGKQAELKVAIDRGDTVPLNRLNWQIWELTKRIEMNADESYMVDAEKLREVTAEFSERVNPPILQRLSAEQAMKPEMKPEMKNAPNQLNNPVK